MFTANLDRATARRLSILMLGVVGVGGFGVGALAFGGERGLPTPPKPSGDASEPDSQEPETTVALPKIDARAFAANVAENLGSMYDWAQLAPEDTPPIDAEVENAVPGAEQVRYLGSIIGPERRLAIMSINGRQRIVAEGSMVEGIRLLRVTEDEIDIQRANRPQKLQKAPSSGPMITMISPRQGGDQGPGLLPEDLMERERLEGLTDKQRQMRIDQDIERARENALQRYKGEYRDGTNPPSVPNQELERGVRGGRGATQTTPAGNGAVPTTKTTTGNSGNSTNPGNSSNGASTGSGGTQ
jgi:hypothetical protein